MGAIRTHVASSYRVVEEGPDRLVIQANWMNHAGCAPAFLLFGLPAFLLPGSARLVGIAFCAVAVLALAWGIAAARRRVVFDRITGVVRCTGGGPGPVTVPFGDIAGLERRTLELHGDGEPAYYYRLRVLTTSGGDIDVCESRDETYIADLSARVGRLIGKDVSATTERTGD